MAPRFWRRHLRSLLLLALLHRLNCLAFLAACAPVLLLTAFLLGVVLVHSDVPREDADDRHLYKKIRHHHIIISSSPSLSSSEQEEEDMMEEEELGNKAAVAWTVDDECSIQSIRSLELEREARLKKLMARRSSLQRNLIDLDVHIPAIRNHSDFDINKDPSSAPSSLQLRHPFHDVQRAKDKEMLTQHESFTAPLNRLSRFRPYFVAADILEGAKSNFKKSSSSSSSSTSSSSSSSAASDHQKEQQTLQVKVEEEEEEAAPPSPSPNWDGNRIGMAVNVELISDSSDDDMSLPGGDAAVISMTREHSDDEEEDSFEVASITQQVAAGHQQQQLQVQMCEEEAQPQHQHQRQQEDGEASVEREVSKIREHHALGPVPVVVDSCSSSSSLGAGGAGAGAGAGSAGAGTGAAAGTSSGGKSSIKFKAPSKKAVFGFFRK